MSHENRIFGGDDLGHTYETDAPDGSQNGKLFRGLKWPGIGVLAFAVTTGLAVTMTALIAVEYKAQDALETGEFAINPMPDDIVIGPKRTEIDSYKKVETPPPPPTIPKDAAENVIVEPVIVEWRGTPFDPATIKVASVNEIKITKDYQPILRTEPPMPMRATKSGHCQMMFDVSPEGRPFNVTTTYCTEKHFERPSIKAVQGWKYLPQYEEGLAVSVSDVKTRISFNLTDERGQIIPE